MSKISIGYQKRIDAIRSLLVALEQDIADGSTYDADNVLYKISSHIRIMKQWIARKIEAEE